MNDIISWKLINHEMGQLGSDHFLKWDKQYHLQLQNKGLNGTKWLIWQLDIGYQMGNTSAGSSGIMS
jgi:hypothetical protein